MELANHTNQALGLAEYARQFIHGELDEIAPVVLQRTALFHLDSVACGIAALAVKCNAPTVLREEALRYPRSDGAVCLGGGRVAPEKAVVANCSAVRELDANGTNFGYNPERGDHAGEFGHNDFYPVVVAGAQLAGLAGKTTLRAMVCLDEIRGRLAEVFSLKDHRIDHVVHGAIAAAAVYGALRGASAEQIESAIGMLVAHAIPFRAIRAGHQLSDSKGASAAWSAETAVLAVERALLGFRGPADVFRNPQAIFCLFEPPATANESPFSLSLADGGDKFAIMGMHFKLGIYEHQSAGAIHGLIELLQNRPELVLNLQRIQQVKISIYEPAFSIIGDPAKRNPTTRQSADHSMVYIVATILRKAKEQGVANWHDLMLTPEDYDQQAIADPGTRQWMDRIEFTHGGDEFDALYPQGIPTRLQLVLTDQTLDSGLVLYPHGHAACPSQDWLPTLHHKIERFAGLGVSDVSQLTNRMMQIELMTSDEVQNLYNFPIHPHG